MRPEHFSAGPSIGTRVRVAAIALRVVATLLVAQPVLAQAAPHDLPPPGTRVGINLPDTVRSIFRGGGTPSWLKGTLVASDEGVIVLRVASGDSIRIRRTAQQTLYVRRGVSRPWSALKSAALATIVSASVVQSNRDDLSTRAQHITLGSWAAVGALVGALLPSERWTRMRR
jgi:hypothetical protein